MDYILWGESWANIQLMMADALRIDYQAKSGSDKNKDNEVLDLNDPKAFATLKLMAGGGNKR